MTIDRARLARTLNPTNVAVVGDTRIRGYRWLRSMSTVRGKLYSVQVDESELPGIEELGVPSYRSLTDIPDEIDYVLVAVPRNVAPIIMRDCIAKGVGGAAFFTSGFAETDTDEGRQLQTTITEMAREADLPVIGPNCMGLYNPSAGVRFAPAQPAGFEGNVAFVSQSGGHAADFATTSHAMGVAAGTVVSFGNGVVLENADYLEYFAHDDGTEFIAMYVEGLRDGRRFSRLLRETTPRKPVILWKGGMSDAGQRATASHTASLAGSAEVWNALCRQAGAIQAESMVEIVDLLKALMLMPDIAGPGVGITGGSGGQSVAMADTFSRVGLRVPTLTDESYDRLNEWFSLVGASFRNPIDMGTNREEITTIMEVLSADPNIDCLVMQVRPAMGEAIDAGRLEAQLGALKNWRSEGQPAVAITYSSDPLGEADALRDLDIQLREIRVPSFPTYERAATAIRKVLDYQQFHRDAR